MKVTDKQNEGNLELLKSIGSVLNRENQFGFNWYAIPEEVTEVWGAPKMFALSWKSPSQHLVGCSTEVPEKFRKYWVIHEFLEESKPEYAGKCLDTLKEELKLVPNILTGEYIPVRAEFFKGLVEYASNSSNMTREQVEQFTLSRNYLNQLEKEVKGNQNGN